MAIALACMLPASAGLAEQVAPAPKVLRVATSGDYAPFSFSASSSPQVPSADLNGFDIDVANQFALEHGYTLEFVRFRWPDLAGELAAASFDVAMSGVTIRPERSIAGRFSVPIAATHAVALTWKGSGSANFEELDRPARRIAVNAGGHLEKVARHVFRRADIVPLHDNDAVRMAMLDRTFDAVVTDNFEEKVWTAGARDVVRISPLSDDRKAYLLPADRTVLAAQLDRWLLAREKDGTLEKLRIRHFRGDGHGDSAPHADAANAPAETARPLTALAAAVVERLALMPMVYEAKRNAGKAIEDKEQEAAILDGAQRAVAAEAAARAAASSAGATLAAPDAEAVRALFEALIAIGKDAQQKLADRDSRRRPGSVQDRSSARNADSGTPADETATAPAAAPAVEANAADTQVSATDAAAVPTAAVPTAAVPTAAAPAARSSTAARHRVYDLSTELRPAIGRISVKIAAILAAMDSPISMVEARRSLGNALAPHEVRSEQVDALASAIVRISTRQALP